MYRAFETDWKSIIAALRWSQEFVAASHAFGDLSGNASDHLPPEHYREWGQRIEEWVTMQKATLSEIEQRFDPHGTPWQSWGDAALTDLQGWAADLAQASESAVAWVQYLEAVAALERATAPGVVGALRAVEHDAGEVPRIVRRRVLEAWLEEVYSREPELRQFTSSNQEGLVAEFRKLDEELPTAARAAIRREAYSRYPQRVAPTVAVGEVATLRGQLSRRRGQLPVRKLLHRIPVLATQLKPCFMMSPLAVSQYLQRAELASETIQFDVVIFDEASQVFPEDAIPAISRAEQVVVVGDANQLPPTSFFRRTIDDDDPQDDESDALEGRDSILDAMVGRAEVDQRYLTVHYRSRHESLIRFSNHQYYRDRLQVFPSPELDAQALGIVDSFVPDARYDAGRTRTNRLEAERVVDLAFEILRTVPLDESVGVIALSRAQADLIQSLIDDRRLLEAGLDSRFSEEHPEPFFVKNLENVQGDERDHVILCVGYGPTVATGQTPNRFGPLNSDLGWRRLNVAVTRARRSLHVVHSINPASSTSQVRGAVELRRFLEFAASPLTAIEARQIVDPDAEPDSPFEDSVKRALERRGYRVQPQVGVAGYRIDLAIYSDDAKRFDLGIECDGFTYHSSPTARDRDWLRQSVLEGLGWHIHRVWSTAWVRDQERELDAIERAIEVARAAGVAQTGRADDQEGADAHEEHDEEPLWAVPVMQSPPNQGHLFEEYRIARLPRANRWEELRYAPPERLQSLILHVIETRALFTRTLWLYDLGTPSASSVQAARRRTPSKPGSNEYCGRVRPL